MPDQFQETRTIGLGNRLIDSIKGVVAGLLLFVISFGLLYWNEGRANRADQLLDQAKNAVEINAANPDAGAQNKLVAAKGDLATSETLQDNIVVPDTQQNIKLAPGNYLKLARTAEMYSWKEEKQTSSEKNIGGSETEKTTYTYTNTWTSSPQNSSEFKVVEGHINPSMSVGSAEYLVNSSKLGSLSVALDRLSLPDEKKLALTPQLLSYVPAALPNQQNTGDYIFIGKGTLSAPQIGDIRMSYTYLPSPLPVTAFGTLDGTSLSPFVDKKNGTLYRAFTGTKAEAIGIMASENNMMTWLLRLLGFILMWVGLGMFFGPISTLLDILPIAGSISRGLIGIATFCVALGLSIITILISMIVHNFIALIIALIIAIVLAVFILKGVFKKRQSTPARS